MANLMWLKEVFRTLPGTRVTHESFSNDRYLVSHSDGVIYDECGNRMFDMNEDSPAYEMLPDNGWHYYKGGPAR